MSLQNIWKTANVSSIFKKETGVILPLITLLASPVLPVKNGINNKRCCHNSFTIKQYPQ